MTTDSIPPTALHPADPAPAPGRTSVPPRDPRFRLDAVAGLVLREWMVFTRVWQSIMFGAVVEPIVYLVAFGFGFGALIAEVEGIPYLDFMATGSAAIAVLFSGFFPGLINGYFRRNENRLYEGLMATPITVAELVTGEAVWTAAKTTLSASMTIVIAAAFGVSFQPSVILLLPVAFVGGFAYACFGAVFASQLRTTHQFDFVIAGVLVPMFVIAGSFFPLDGTPVWLQTAARANPMTYMVDLFRAAAFGLGTAAEIAVGITVLVGFAAASWALAVRLLGRALKS